MPTLAHIMDTLSDDKSLALFNTIALNGGNSTLLISKLSLTRKQYYSKISRMIKNGLIKRSNGRLSLTAFGKIIYQAHLTMGQAIEFYWKLKAVDSLEITDIPAERYDEIVPAYHRLWGHGKVHYQKHKARRICSCCHVISIPIISISIFKDSISFSFRK